MKPSDTQAAAPTANDVPVNAPEWVLASKYEELTEVTIKTVKQRKKVRHLARGCPSRRRSPPPLRQHQGRLSMDKRPPAQTTPPGVKICPWSPVPGSRLPSPRVRNVANCSPLAESTGAASLRDESGAILPTSPIPMWTTCQTVPRL